MSRRQKPIAIVGLGAVSPIGIGVPEFVGALRRGESGVHSLPEDMPGAAHIRSTVAARCDRFDPLDVMGRADVDRLPRLVPMALRASREAIEQSCLSGWLEDDRSGSRAQRVGLILGTGAGGIDFTLDQAQRAFDPERDPSSLRGLSLWTITNATHGNLAGELSIRLGLQGPSLCISTGCASSSDALGQAMEMLRSERPGSPSAMVVIGADAHVRWETLCGMELLRAITTTDYRHHQRDASTASRPFDRERDGFVLGEGAWAIVLERAESARERCARVLGELLGYGVTCDAYHRVRPDPDMAQSARAMRESIDDAGIDLEDVQIIHYHGTSTVLNDACESRAVRMVFGETHAHRLIGHSVKSMIGHPQGACGAAALVSTLGSMRNLDTDSRGPFSPPTTNLDEPDIDGGCDLDYTPNEPVPIDADHRSTFLVNCLAFGAKNSALVARTGAAPA